MSLSLIRGLNVFKNKKIMIGTLLFVLLAGVWLFFKVRKTPEKTFQVTKGNLIEATYAVGLVKADQVYNLKLGVNSKMLERLVRVGDRVKKGQALFRLDSFPLFTAPFDGVVTALNYEMGELVFANSVIITLLNDKKLYLELSLDERSITKVKPGQVARIGFTSFKKDLNGKVRAQFSTSDQFYVHVDFSDLNFDEYKPLVGMTADVSIITHEHKDAILVPVGAIDGKNEVICCQERKRISLDILYRSSEFAVVKNPELTPGTVLYVSAAGINDKNGKGSR